ncbi:MAG: hypothetical protein SWH54_09405 [Thermodesulfobacteriota bacterium]|nr:hypothetical protein [Thermodesulfobacteriota bacterium]
MKKMIMTALAVSFVFIVAMPAMALEFEVDGHYYTEGLYHEHPDLRDNHQNDYLTMELRLKPVFKFSDNLSLITRFDALATNWGNADADNATVTGVQLFNSAGGPAGTSVVDSEEYDDNIDWDWAYLQFKTGIGMFLVGRQNGNVWGTDFIDSAGPRDRVTWIVPINNLYLAGVYEKNAEYDSDDVNEGSSDNDKYYLTATYKGEGFKAGLLYGYYKYRTFQDMAQASDTAAATQLANNAGYDLGSYMAALQAGSPPDGGALYGQILGAGIDTNNLSTCEATAHILIPYFEGKFGPVGIQGELAYATADADYDIINSAGTDSKDATLMAYNLEGTYDVGPLTFQAGYALSSGDADYTDDDVESFGYIEPGYDWAKTLILYSDIAGLEETLGGLGNPVGGGKASWDGYQVYYFGVDYNVLDNLSLGAIVAKSKADDVTAGWDDDHGLEYDLTLNWKIFDNLTYTATYAALDAGDYWEMGNPATDVEDTFVLYHKLELLF